MIRESWSHTLEQELARQRDAMRQLGFTDDYREGVHAFLEKPATEVHRPMIISLEHRFIFAAIGTGTHAVRRALREHMGAQDMEQVGLFVQRKLPIPELAQIRHGHLTLQQIRRHLSAEDF